MRDGKRWWKMMRDDKRLWKMTRDDKKWDDTAAVPGSVAEIIAPKKKQSLSVKEISISLVTPYMIPLKSKPST